MARGARAPASIGARGELERCERAYPGAHRCCRDGAGCRRFGDSLSDAQIAEVVNYVRSHFDNRYANALSAEEVARLRATLSSAGGSP
jgi:hypothetical protein